MEKQKGLKDIIHSSVYIMVRTREGISIFIGGCDHWEDLSTLFQGMKNYSNFMPCHVS